MVEAGLGIQIRCVGSGGEGVAGWVGEVLGEIR